MGSVAKVFQKTLTCMAKLSNLTKTRFYSNTVCIAKRNEIFDNEAKRQHTSVGRIEKIEVRYLGLPEDTTLIMNRDISTPFHCAQHLSEGHCKRAALALIDGHVSWDMHRPLVDSCTLQLLNFNVADPHAVNRAFWRTCSFMLGAALVNCFKEDARLRLHSFPTPNVKSGSFVYDIVLGTKSWSPTKGEMRAISSEMVKLAGKDLKIERLEVNGDLALEMFKEARYKHEQLPNIIQNNKGNVVLYRVGDHIDISKGPMVGSTRFLGKCTITAAHKVADEGADDSFFRVQGVALPIGTVLNHVAYNILEKRAEKLNPARLPNEPYEESLMQIA